MFIQGNRKIKKGTIDGRLIEIACLGSNNLLESWIILSAQLTILTNFGLADGEIVINAVDNYLDELSSTNNNNAQILASCINNDPMMVCSLGLLPSNMQGVMPIRRAKGNSNCVKLGEYDLSIISYDIKAWLYNLSEHDTQIIGGNSWSYSAFITQIINSKICNTMCDGSTQNYLNSHDISMSLINNVVSIQGRVKNRTASFSGIKPIYIFGTGTGHKTGSGVSSVIIQSALNFTNDADWFLPTVINGEVEFVNIRTGLYAERTGSLSITIDNPDGTTWSPINSN